MNAAQKLTKRAMKKERQIVNTFAKTAEAAGMTPEQLASSSVMIYADVRTQPARVAVHHLNPNPEIRSGGPRIVTAADRGHVVEVMRRDARTPETETLAAMLQSPPQEGFFWLLCVAGAPGEQMISWSVSMIAWSVHGAALEQGEILRDDAITLWHAIGQQHPGFWDDYPRETGGAVTDDERVEMVRAGWEALKANTGAN